MNFIFPVLFTNVVKEKHPHKEEMYNSDLFIQVKISPTQSTQLVLVLLHNAKLYLLTIFYYPQIFSQLENGPVSTIFF